MGVLMGVVGVACWFGGMSIPLWSFVAPHGVLELPAIFIAGGAGLQDCPGVALSRTARPARFVAKAGGEAVRLVLGVVPILIVAGTIEGFFSPSPAIPWQMKFVTAAAIAIIFFSYLLFAAELAKPKINQLNSVAALRIFSLRFKTAEHHLPC